MSAAFLAGASLMIAVGGGVLWRDLTVGEKVLVVLMGGLILPLIVASVSSFFRRKRDMNSFESGPLP